MARKAKAVVIQNEEQKNVKTVILLNFHKDILKKLYLSGILSEALKKNYGKIMYKMMFLTLLFTLMGVYLGTVAQYISEIHILPGTGILNKCCA